MHNSELILDDWSKFPLLIAKKHKHENKYKIKQEVDYHLIPNTTLIVTRFIRVADIALCSLCPVDITTPGKKKLKKKNHKK